MCNIKKYIQTSILFAFMFASGLQAAPLMSLAQPEIEPSPLNTVENNGEGRISFLISERNGEEVTGNNKFKVAVSLGKVTLKNNDINSVKVQDGRLGYSDVTNKFDVRYLPSDSLIIIQQKSTESLPANMRYKVIIPVEVTENTSVTNPGNGFLVNMSSEANAIANGDSSDYTYTKASAPVITCGNGMLDANEGCDDGNTANGDGCNASCKVETSNRCNVDVNGLRGNASCASNICDKGTCEAANTCGNGVLEAGEGCDDSETIDHDGCSASCKIETGNTCNSNRNGATGNSGCVSNYCNAKTNTCTINQIPTVTPTPTATPTATATPTVTPTPTATVMPTATVTPTPTATSKPVSKPTAAPMTCSNVKQPIATNDNVGVKMNEAAIVNVQKNDKSDMPLNKESIRLIDSEGDEVTTLDVEGKGVWSVNTDNGHVVFTSEDDFTGTVRIQYVIKDSCGHESNRATITVTYNENTVKQCNSVSDSGSALGTLSMFFLMLFTGLIGLYYVRREELTK